MQAEHRIRNLVVQRIPKEELEEARSTTEATHFIRVPATGGGYEEWTAVSHTLTILDNGDGFLSILLERSVPSEAPKETFYMD
jgi:hypothetical protein